MTDKNAEKIEPCAWCGAAPFVTFEKDCICDSERCPNRWCDRPGIDGWNDIQALILARRRADFEAGWKDGHQWQPDGEPYRTDDIQEFFDLYLSQPPADGER